MSVRNESCEIFHQEKKFIFHVDSDSSFVNSDKHESKRINYTVEEERSVMAVQQALDDINKRLEALDSLATKDDLKTEVRTLTENFMKKIGELEGRVFDLEARSDKKDQEFTSLAKKNEELHNAVKTQELKVRQTEREINDLQQYSRRWNVRVYRVPETEGEQMEDCIKKVCCIFSQDVGITTSPSNIEVAHQKARPILVRVFFIVTNETEVKKNKGVVIGEDLTFENYKLSTAAHRHSATMSVWSVNGRVYAKLKNGLNIKLNIHMNLDVTFHKTLTSSNVMSDTE